MEQTFWTALRTLEEQVLLLQSLERALRSHTPQQARAFLALAEEAQARARRLRQVMFEPPLGRDGR